MADGSVRFISDSIEIGTLELNNFRVWQRLNASADGLAISPEAF